MRTNGCKSFYEYFFEPSGKSGMVFFQFLHNDFKQGMRVKKIIENITYFTQLFFITCILFLVVIFRYYPKYKKVCIHYNYFISPDL